MKKRDKTIIFLLLTAMLTLVIIGFIIPDSISSLVKIALSLPFYIVIIVSLVYYHKLNKKELK